MNYLECIPLTLFDRITVWIIMIKRERKGSANKRKFIVSFVLPIHLLPIHVLPIQSMFYKSSPLHSSPLHSSPCFTTCPKAWVALGKFFEEFVYLALGIYYRGTLPTVTPSFQVGKNFENRKIHQRRRSAWVG